MKTLIWTGVAALLISVLLFIISSIPDGDVFRFRPSHGYVTFAVGLVTLCIGICQTRQAKALALLISGIVLVIFGEQFPSLVFGAVFGKENVPDLREGSMILVLLGTASVLISWAVLTISSKSENEK
jgi:hypothetical protein